MRHTIAIPGLSKLNAAALEGLGAELAFCHPVIRGVATVDAAGESVTLEIEREHPDLAPQVMRVVEACARAYRLVAPLPPVWTLPGGPSSRQHVEAFVATHTRALGPGQVALLPAAARLRRELDLRFREVALGLGAEEWHLPSIESTGELIPQVGYFRTHAQLVTFGYRLPERFDTIRKFAEAAGKRRLAWPEPEHEMELVPTGFILEPFVCHNVYRALRGARTGGVTVTALGNCYRHEGFRFSPLTRQWEFSMREVVFCGPDAEVRAGVERAVAATRAVCERLGLAAALEVASDPFFSGTAASPRAFQLAEASKLELRLALGDGGTAAASFNRHGAHFTTPMDISGPAGEPLVTACVGWGLERWMAAFVARHGADPAAWPEVTP